MENKPLIHHWISISILSEIMQKSPAKIRKIYRSIIQDECIPLIEIPLNLQNIYVKDYLLRDRMIDFSFLDAIKDYSFSTPLKNPDVQSLFREMEMMRKAFEITRTFSASGNVTEHLRELASEYHISYSTLARRRSLYMNSTPLYRALSHSASTEDTRDARPFSCKKCPYHPDMKAKPHNKKDYIPFATCKRNSEFMVKPNCDDTVCSVIRNIPEQQDVLAWAGVRSWAAQFHYTPAREKSGLVNQCWIADHKKCDIWVRTKLLPDGTWEIKRPWITAILDSATNVMVSYVLSLNPNSDCIAECFARACAFTVDTPYSGICDYFYIDNGKDFRSKKLNGLPNSEEDHLYLNKDFGESGILEWFGIKVIHALPYRGCSKTIESIWGTIDDEWFRELPGYCGSRPSERPYILDEQIKKNELYTFEQFADYFADTIYPEYNNFSVTKESPNELYSRLPKTSSFVPSWRTLSVLKSVTGERVIRSKGIQFGNNKFYWCSELGPLIEKEKSTKYRIFAFDTPFNRNISVVYDHQYIGEAHLIEKLNVVEKKRYKVIQHLMEQQEQHKFYSKRLEQLHSLVFQSDILDEVCSIPPVDNIRYGQAIDTERDKNEAADDNAIPEELKAQAESYANNFLNREAEYLAYGNGTKIDVLRQIFDETDVPIILCGTYVLKDLISGERKKNKNKTHNRPQIFRRLRKEEFDRIEEKEIYDYLLLLEQQYAVSFEPRVKSELVSLCRDRQSGGLGNFIEIIELLFSQIRPEWQKISYQIIQESGRILHNHTEEAQSFTAIKADKIDLEEAEKNAQSASPPVAFSSSTYIDVSKLSPAYVDMAILKDSLRHKMAM